MGAVDDLELDVAPVGDLDALVLAVADPGGLLLVRAVAASDAANSTWIISQSLSCLLLKSLNG